MKKNRVSVGYMAAHFKTYCAGMMESHNNLTQSLHTRTTPEHVAQRQPPSMQQHPHPYTHVDGGGHQDEDFDDGDDIFNSRDGPPGSHTLLNLPHNCGVPQGMAPVHRVQQGAVPQEMSNEGYDGVTLPTKVLVNTGRTLPRDAPRHVARSVFHC